MVFLLTLEFCSGKYHCFRVESTDLFSCSGENKKKEIVKYREQER